MSKLRQLMDASRNQDEYNFISLKGGKFNIPPEVEKRFWRYFARSVDEELGLVYSLPFREHLPLTLDIDIVHNTSVQIPDEELEGLMMALAECTIRVTQIDCGLTLYGLRKPEATLKGDVWKNGAHIIIAGVLVTREVANKIREDFLNCEVVCDFVQQFYVTDKNELLDDRVSPFGKNGLYLAPQKKPGRSAGYHCFSTFQVEKRQPINLVQFDSAAGREFVLTRNLCFHFSRTGLDKSRSVQKTKGETSQGVQNGGE